MFTQCPSDLNAYGPFCGMEYASGCSGSIESIDLIPESHHGCLESAGIPVVLNYELCDGFNCSIANLYDKVIGWHIIILVEFIPLTIMIVLIIVLDIKLVGGHITGYILYCQIISLPFAATFNPGQYYTEPLMSLWNLNFVNPFLNFKFCISNTVGGLGMILFWYIVAFYPLVLLLLLYIWIIMYERGWRIVVCITQPVHRLLARFWLKFDIHPSLIDSIAGIYILCFTQIAATSLKVLHFSRNNETDPNYLTFYYDESLPYFKRLHICAGFFAIIILIVCVIIPTVYLLLYPFKFFQKFLEVSKLRTQLTDAVVDSLTGSLNNGSENTYDYRSFAGLYLLLRIIIICLHYVEVHEDPTDEYCNFYASIMIISYLSAGLFTIIGGAIIIFRPFRRKMHNFSNFVLIFLFLNVYELILATSLAHFSSYCVDYYGLGGLHSITYISATILLALIVIGYCTYTIIKKSRIACGFIPKMRNLPANDDGQSLLQQSVVSSSLNDDFDADRMANPDNYEEKHYSNAWLESHILHKKQSRNTTLGDEIPLILYQADHGGSDDVDEGGSTNAIKKEDDTSAPYRLWSETEAIN